VPTTLSRLTAANRSPGTPCYMSPEQLRGEEVGCTTDVWALGVVAYEMISGARPFDGATPLQVGLRTLRDPVPRLPEAPPEVEALIRAMLEKSVRRRAW